MIDYKCFIWDTEYCRDGKNTAGNRSWTLETDILRIDINDYREKGRIVYKWWIYDNNYDIEFDSCLKYPDFKKKMYNLDEVKADALKAAQRYLESRLRQTQKDIKFINKFKNISVIKEKLL